MINTIITIPDGTIRPGKLILRMSTDYIIAAGWLLDLKQKCEQMLWNHMYLRKSKPD